jgi:hypothetical protein
MLRMLMDRRLVIGLAATALLTGVPRLAMAQSRTTGRTYVSASLLADIKRFSGDPAQPVLDGESMGGAFTIGTGLWPRWDLQVGVDIPRISATSRDRSVTLQKSTFVLASVTENRGVSVATLVRFRGASRGRVQLGYLGGLSLVRLRRDVHTQADGGTPAGLIPRPESTVDFSAAPTIGIDARIMIGKHLSLVPAVHATAFSVSDANGLLLRPRLSVRWSF